MLLLGTWSCQAEPVHWKKGRDRILILEDTDQDGSFETHKVFMAIGGSLQQTGSTTGKTAALVQRFDAGECFFEFDPGNDWRQSGCFEALDAGRGPDRDRPFIVRSIQLVDLTSLTLL